MARARRGRRRKGDQSPVTREEFDALYDLVNMVEQRAMFGRGIQSVPGGGAAGDDGYEPTYPGTIDNSGTVGGYLPGEIPYLTDETPPASSPTADVTGGIGFFSVKWTAVANADPVTYEVHVSTTTGFTPDATTFSGETNGTLAFIKTLPNGSAFAYGTTYYFKIMAKDADGGGYADPTPAAGTQDSATLVKAGTDELQSDGLTPSAPTVTLKTGPGWLQPKWTAAGTTSDPVVYNVYISATNGFTPGVTSDALTPVFTTAARSVVINELVAGTQLTTGTTYYIKVIATSTLGSGLSSSASTQVSGTPDVLNAAVTTISNLDAGTITTGSLDAGRIAAGSLDASKITSNTITSTQIAADAITTSELAADAVIAENILAGEVTADKLQAVLTMTTAILAGAFGGSNVQMGYGVKDDGTGSPMVDEGFIGVRAYNGSDVDPVFKLPADGSPATFRGVVKFGSVGTSKLLQNDMIQLLEQPGGSFANRLLVQSSNGTENNETTYDIEFDSTPVVGNALIIVIQNYDGGGAAAHTVTGWTSLHNNQFGGVGNGRCQVLGKIATGTDDGAPGDPIVVSLDKNTDQIVWTAMEWSGVTLTENVPSEEDEDNTSGAVTLNTTGIASTSNPCILLGVGALHGPWDSVLPDTSFPSFQVSTYPAGWTNVSRVENVNISDQREAEQVVFYKSVAAADTSAFIIDTNADSAAAVAIILALEASANNVEPADADSVRLYAADVSGNTYLHSQDEDGRESSVVIGSAGEVFRLSLQTFNHNFNGGAAISAHSGGADTHTITCGANDFAILAEYTGGENYLHFKLDITGTNTLTLRWFNADSVSRTPGSVGITILVVHRT